LKITGEIIMVNQLERGSLNVIELDVGGMTPPKIREYLREYKKTIQDQLDELKERDIRFILIPKRSY